MSLFYSRKQNWWPGNEIRNHLSSPFADETIMYFLKTSGNTTELANKIWLSLRITVVLVWIQFENQENTFKLNGQRHAFSIEIRACNISS